MRIYGQSSSKDGSTVPYKVFVSIPMNGLSSETIKHRMRKAMKQIQKNCPVAEMIDTLYEEDLPSPLHYLAKAIGDMAEADLVVFCPNWKEARGCVIEHEIAKSYNKPVKYLQDWE